MIDSDHPLPLSRQVKLVAIARSSAYYQPRPVSEVVLKLMRRIDELHLEHPFAGARMLGRLLWREGIQVGRRHVATLGAGRASVPRHQESLLSSQGWL
jgi:putative transposase